MVIMRVLLSMASIQDCGLFCAHRLDVWDRLKYLKRCVDDCWGVHLDGMDKAGGS
jgi:hypothetical protein